MARDFHRRDASAFPHVVDISPQAGALNVGLCQLYPPGAATDLGHDGADPPRVRRSPANRGDRRDAGLKFFAGDHPRVQSERPAPRPWPPR